MKIGFVLECTLNGPDSQIYPWVAQKICPHLEIAKPETLGNKENVIQDGPIVAQTLLEDGCDFIFIIWDRIPKWGTTGKCEDHIKSLQEGIEKLGIDEKKIILCCIDEMLESWMIVNGQAVTDYFQGFSPKSLPYFGDNKNKASQSDPKNRIKKFNGRYNDFVDNFKIVKLMSDFEMPARWNESFRYFKTTIEQICASKK